MNYSQHPIKLLYDKGVKMSINTDNRTVSDITLNKEYENLVKYHHFGVDDFKKMNIMALDYAFLDEEWKIKLRKMLDI